jgi:hypothetical protein
VGGSAPGNTVHVAQCCAWSGARCRCSLDGLHGPLLKACNLTGVAAFHGRNTIHRLRISVLHVQMAAPISMPSTSCCSAATSLLTSPQSAKAAKRQATGAELTGGQGLFAWIMCSHGAPCVSCQSLAALAHTSKVAASCCDPVLPLLLPGMHACMAGHHGWHMDFERETKHSCRVSKVLLSACCDGCEGSGPLSQGYLNSHWTRRCECPPCCIGRHLRPRLPPLA